MPVPLVRLLLSCVLAGCALSGAARAQLYADVLTSKGRFTVELFHKQVPRTVANFVGLAEGTQPWWDFPRGRLQVGRPYYDGITFHRVIPNFMIQTGSRNGQGTDGPGYKFPDELVKNAGGELIYRHVGPGIVSMANSGVHTNGSQFFVTLSTQSHLDDKHTVFGRVTAGEGGSPTFEEGMAVVNAIAAVPRNSSDRPLEPVVLERILIRRVGAEAEAFDARQWELPQVRGSVAADLQRVVKPAPDPAELNLTWSADLFRAYHVTYTYDLRGWNLFETTPIFDEAKPFQNRPLNSQEASLFFQVVEVDYSALVTERLVDLSPTAVIKFRIGTTNPLELTVRRTPEGGTWQTGDGATGNVLVMTDGAGPGDAGLFSPQATIAFASPPFRDGTFPGLSSFTPTLTFDAHSSTQGYFTARAQTFQDPPQNVTARGIFTILSP